MLCLPDQSSDTEAIASKLSQLALDILLRTIHARRFLFACLSPLVLIIEPRKK